MEASARESSTAPISLPELAKSVRMDTVYQMESARTHRLPVYRLVQWMVPARNVRMVFLCLATYALSRSIKMTDAMRLPTLTNASIAREAITTLIQNACSTNKYQVDLP